MAKFEKKDKVVAPTVFEGIGIVTELQEQFNKERYIVVYDGLKDWYFTEDGKLISWHEGTHFRDEIMLYAAIPALHHYKEPDSKSPLSFAEAMRYAEKGGSVFHERKPNLILFRSHCGGLTFSNIENKTLNANILDVMLKELSSFHAKQDRWYIYEEQETVEWSPKKYESVLTRNDKNYEWRLYHFSEYNPKRNDTYKYSSTYYEHIYCIPFEGNEHLLGTTEEPRVKYMIKETNNG